MNAFDRIGTPPGKRLRPARPTTPSPTAGRIARALAEEDAIDALRQRANKRRQLNAAIEWIAVCLVAFIVTWFAAHFLSVALQGLLA